MTPLVDVPEGEKVDEPAPALDVHPLLLSEAIVRPQVGRQHRKSVFSRTSSLSDMSSFPPLCSRSSTSRTLFELTEEIADPTFDALFAEAEASMQLTVDDDSTGSNASPWQTSSPTNSPAPDLLHLAMINSSDEDESLWDRGSSSQFHEWIRQLA